jgi:hypothetical protein
MPTSLTGKEKSIIGKYGAESYSWFITEKFDVDQLAEDASAVEKFVQRLMVLIAWNRIDLEDLNIVIELLEKLNLERVQVETAKTAELSSI